MNKLLTILSSLFIVSLTTQSLITYKSNNHSVTKEIIATNDSKNEQEKTRNDEEFFDENPKKLENSFNKKTLYRSYKDSIIRWLSTYKTEIQKIIREINNDYYHELFYPYNDQAPTEEFKKKILFKLSQIIDKKTKDLRYEKANGRIIKHPWSPSIIIDAVSDVQQNLNKYPKKSNNYKIALRIQIFVCGTLYLDFEETLLWKNKITNSPETEAQNFILSLNKRMFFETMKVGQDLFELIKAGLGKISLDFNIKPWWNNMSLSLKKIDFKIHVYLGEQWIFDAYIEDNLTTIDYWPTQVFKSNQTLKKDILKTHEIKNYFDKVVKVMKDNLSEFWDINDTIGELTKTANYLMQKLFTKEVSDQIFITTDHSPKTKLKELINQNFSWHVMGYKTYLIYENSEMNVYKIAETNQELISRIIPKLKKQNVFLNRIELAGQLPNEIFLNTADKIFWFIQNKLNTISYSLTLKSRWPITNVKTSNSHFFFHVYDQGEWLMDAEFNFIDNWYNWKFYFQSDYDGKDFVVKDRNSKQDIQTINKDKIRDEL